MSLEIVCMSVQQICLRNLQKCEDPVILEKVIVKILVLLHSQNLCNSEIITYV